MSKCHYIYTEEGEKILIPECWPVVLSGDMRDCICRTEKTYATYEKERYNEEVRKLRKEISELEKENAQLYRTIRKLAAKGKTIQVKTT